MVPFLERFPEETILTDSATIKVTWPKSELIVFEKVAGSTIVAATPASDWALTWQFAVPERPFRASRIKIIFTRFFNLGSFITISV